MVPKDSNRKPDKAYAFRFSKTDRNELSAYLRPDTADRMLRALEALVTQDHTLPAFATYEKPKSPSPPSDVERNRGSIVAKLKKFASTVTSRDRELLEGFWNVVSEMRPAQRNADPRSEYKKFLCGWIGKVWGSAAKDPTDRQARTRFAIQFLDGCGVEHVGDTHRNRLQKWLNQDSPVGWRVAQEELHQQANQNL